MNSTHATPEHTMRGGHRRASGFTLLELMIAVAILAIVMVIAIPSYTDYVIRSSRADGKAMLFQTAQTLERCFTRFSAYDDDDCSISDGDVLTSQEGKYQVTVDSAATTFTLSAAPLDGQANDTVCKTLTLDNTGARGMADGATGTVDDCW